MLTGSGRTWLRDILKPLAPAFREVLAMALFVNLLALAVPVFVLQVYDRVIFHAGISTLQGLAVGMAIVLVFDFVLRQARARVLQHVASHIDIEVGRRLIDRFLALPLMTLERYPAAHWHAVFRDVEVIRNAFSGGSAILVCDLPFAIVFLGLIVVIATPLAWVLAIILPLFIVVAWRSAAALAARSNEERDASQGRDSLLGEIITARTTIKALALAPKMRAAWEDRHAGTIERAVRRGAQADTFANLSAGLTMLSTVALTTVGAVAILDQRLTIGALIAANMLAGRLLGPLNQLIATWRAFAVLNQSIERLGDVFALETERRTSAIRLDRPKGQLTLEDVSFTYPDAERAAIDHVSLALPAGGVHGLIGRNGSGKTTLLKLAQGLYRPTTGRVLLDEANIGQFTRAELAAWIGYVPQQCALFAGSLRDNLAARVPDADDEALVAAAERAGAHRFILDLPNGYATDVGEAGGRLSGGQRQRLAIARALVGDPPVVVMDEPSSNLDRHAELALRELLLSLGTSHTVLIVTHSPILLAACSLIIGLDGGRVSLAGPAQEVLRRVLGATGDAPAPPRRPHLVDGA